MLDEHNKVLVKDNEEQLNTVMKENQDRLRFVKFIKKNYLFQCGSRFVTFTAINHFALV